MCTATLLQNDKILWSLCYLTIKAIHYTLAKQDLGYNYALNV